VNYDELDELDRRVWDRTRGVPDNGDEALVVTLNTVPIAEFAAVDEAGAKPLVGGNDDIVIPVNGDVMFYGDGGAGKTTLGIDLACHLGAGNTWLGIPVAAPCRVLIVENEGPRPLFRAKVRRKLAGWTGAALEDRVRIVEAPWARFTFARVEWRVALAERIRTEEIDVVIIGPIVAAGMNDAGTLQEVRAFIALCDEVRQLAGRLVTIILIHHENKGGKVSGSWEGAGDTMIHVTGAGNGHTRMFIQKARWSTTWHSKTLDLVWTDGEGFAVEVRSEVTDDDLAEVITAAVAAEPGTGWGKIEKSTTGTAARKRAIRDRLLRAGIIVNVDRGVVLDRCEHGRAAHLYLDGDPSIRQLCRDADTVPTQSVSAEG
jgi:hypothetical protein